MYPQNAFTAPDIGHIHHHLTVETARSEQGRIQHIRPVGCRHENNPFIGFKPVHFHQELVQGLFSFIMAPA